MNKKHVHLDAIRGIAAAVVLIAHCLQAFYPKVYSQDARSHGGWETWLQCTPANILTNASFAVFIFFVLSGYVLSIKFEQKDTIQPKDAILSTAKRYPRLAIPAGASALIAYLLYRSTPCDYNTIQESTDIQISSAFQSIGLIESLRQGLWGAFTEGRCIINPALWTMKTELIGSFFIYALYAITPKSARPIAITILALIFINKILLPFFLGAMLHHIPQAFTPKRKKEHAALLAAACWLGSFPYYNASESFWWQPLLLIKEIAPTINPMQFWQSIGALLLLLTLNNNKWALKKSQSPSAKLLGELSFPTYLVHFPIILSVGLLTLRTTLNTGINYHIAAISSTVICITFALITALLFSRTIEAPWLRILRGNFFAQKAKT